MPSYVPPAPTVPYTPSSDWFRAFLTNMRQGGQGREWLSARLGGGTPGEPPQDLGSLIQPFSSTGQTTPDQLALQLRALQGPNIAGPVNPPTGPLFAGMLPPAPGSPTPLGPSQQVDLSTPADSSYLGNMTGAGEPLGGAINPRQPSFGENFSNIFASPEKMALLRIGLGLLQPVQPGQSPMGHISQQAMGGLDYLTQMKLMGQKQKVQEKEMSLKERGVSAQEKTAAGVEAERTRPSRTAHERAQAKEAEARAGYWERSAERGAASKTAATREEFVKQQTSNLMKGVIAGTVYMDELPAYKAEIETAANEQYGPLALGKGEKAPTALPPGVPPGSRLLGVSAEKDSEGRKVYLTPEGKQILAK